MLSTSKRDASHRSATLSRGVKETKDALKLRHATASGLGHKRRPASSQAQFKSMRTKVTWGRIWALVWSASLMLDRGKAAISATPAASRVGKKALSLEGAGALKRLAEGEAVV